MRFDQSPVIRAGAQGAPAAKGLAIPFDYVARFELTGDPGHVVEAVINTDVDGVFVAETISYSFEPRRRRPLRIANVGAAFDPRRVTLNQIPASDLLRGVRIAADAIDAAFPRDPEEAADTPRTLRLVDRLAPQYRDLLLEPSDVRRDFSFLFSMIDTATGRELQDEPTHSIASLGSAYGRRPFRRLAQPVSFQPRSSLRLQIIELSNGMVGTLHIVLQGYKQLQIGTCPDTVTTALRAFQEMQQGMVPSGRIIPFDYVAAVNLEAVRGSTHVVEVPVNVEGGFVATGIGYGLQAPPRDVTVSPVLRAGRALTASSAQWDLNLLELGDFAPDALFDGIRVRPDMVRIALLDNGGLAQAVERDDAKGLFERLNRPEDVAFLYRIHDTGTGRDLQNRAIHSIAGLGSADGHRPFRQFARPLVLLPNSALRVTIDELRGRGRLFVVFQGFKVLGSSVSTPVAARGVRRSHARR